MKVQISDFSWNKTGDVSNLDPKLSGLAANPLEQEIYFLIHHSPQHFLVFPNTLSTSFIWYCLASLSICVTRHAVSAVINKFLTFVLYCMQSSKKS